jgi:hypothetical protein
MEFVRQVSHADLRVRGSRKLVRVEGKQVSTMKVSFANATAILLVIAGSMAAFSGAIRTVIPFQFAQ